ncbi:hypothetical protein KAJ02_13215 [Candidatus Bipolaricaulota bacterium]|nr:hypothetical protein [Candidatus Bipolaricaulota bacterium]
MRRVGDRRHHWVFPLIVSVSFLMILTSAGRKAYGELLDVSGQYSLATIVMPVPASLIGVIQVDTPAEMTLLKFGIESELDFTATIWDAKFHLNSAINIAGLERVIIDGFIDLGLFDMKLEIWNAVPFETSTDVSHFPNWVVIPPGDLMYVKTRFETSGEFPGFSFNNLLMIEDVTFPNPYADFVPLHYPVQSQSFHVGDIFTMTFEPYPGVTVRSVTNISADGGSSPVKGYSAPGRVDPESTMCDFLLWNETITVTGLEYCGIPFWFSLKVDPCSADILRLSGGGSFSKWGDLELSGSFSLFPILIGGYSFSFSWCDNVSASVSLSNKFRFQSANVRCNIDIPFGSMTGKFTTAATFASDLEATSISLGVSASQGTFSGGINVGISQQADTLRLSSVSTNFGMTLTPVRITVSVLFGRTGLRQATLDVGVTF